jgi:radical SAM protein with 4Fe4S-binding SPASM domain
MTNASPALVEAFRPADHRPYHVQVEVTWRCNWRCVHCYQDEHELELLETRELVALCDQLRAAGTMHLIVTGGEPLVRADLLEFLDAARAVGLAITLYTNGHAVDDAMANELARRIAVAEVSILAGEDSVHDRLTRVRGSAERAWAGIRHLSATGIDVVVKTPILAPAYETLRMLDARVRALGLEWLADPDISRSYAGAQYPLAYRMDRAALARFHRDFPRFDPTKSSRRADPGAPKGLCLAGRQYAFIDARGDVYPCLNFKSACDVDSARGGAPRARMGNVRVQAFDQIWRTAAIATEIRAATGASFASCATCIGTCQPCMAANYEEHGELFKPARATCERHQAGSGTVARRLPVVS